MAAPRRRRIPLTRRLFLVNVLLLAGIVVAVGALWFVHDRREVHEEYEHRAMTMAETVAAMPAVREDLTAEDPSETLAPLAETLRKASGFRYIVIVDDDGIRQSHPVEEAIGEPPHTDPTPVLQGQTWTGTERGPAGLTLRARVPVRGDDGETVIGYVSAGILAGDVRVASREDIPYILGVSGLVLLLGGGGAHLLARRIRAKTRGLEPEQIAELLDSREALLHAIGDGVLALDHHGRIVLANPPARRLLGLPADDAEVLGRSPHELGLDEPLAAALVDGPSGGRAGGNGGAGGTGGAVDDEDAGELLVAGDRILICRRRRVRPEEPDGGTVITLRDQTDLRRLAEQLDGAHTVTRGLRAQRHEFANRIHTVAGMLELGAVDRARAFVAELSAETTRDGAEIAERLADPAVAALTLAKAAQAAERQTEFTLAELSSLPDDLEPGLRDDLLLVIGNLVDNALDAAGAGGRVELLVRQHALAGAGAGDVVEIRVTDSGPGLDAGEEQVFAAGFSTKTGADEHDRGLGLALVRQACRRQGGDVVVDVEEETTFSAYLPRESREPSEHPGSGPTGELADQPDQEEGR